MIESASVNSITPCRDGIDSWPQRQLPSVYVRRAVWRRATSYRTRPRWWERKVK
jgi:hypothetical protein